MGRGRHLPHRWTRLDLRRARLQKDYNSHSWNNLGDWMTHPFGTLDEVSSSFIEHIGPPPFYNHKEMAAIYSWFWGGTSFLVLIFMRYETVPISRHSKDVLSSINLLCSNTMLTRLLFDFRFLSQGFVSSSPMRTRFLNSSWFAQTKLVFTFKVLRWSSLVSTMASRTPEPGELTL